MKIESAKAIAQELLDGVITTDEFNEHEQCECVKAVVKGYIQAGMDRFDPFNTYDIDNYIGGIQDLSVKPKFIRTWGTSYLDENIAPLEAHTYCLIAGGQNSGKTAWMLDLALKNARNGGNVLMYSLEMTTKDIIGRYAREKAGITISEFRTREIPQTKKNKYNQAYEYLGTQEGLHLEGTGDNTQSLDDMLEHVKEMSPDLCIIDNLGLINEPGGKEMDKHMSISRKLISFTNTNNIPIILVHHLNKEKSIRGTQKLLDDADAVLLTGRKTREDFPDMEEGEEKEFKIKVKKDRLFGKTEQVHTILFDRGTFIDEDVQPGFRAGDSLNF